MRECIKCQQLKVVTSFNFRSKATKRRNARCRLCTRKDVMTAYYRKQTYYIQRAAERNKKYYVLSVKYIREFLNTHPCVDCGEKDPRVLQFDHVRGQKLKAVSDLVKARCSLAMIIDEIKKCDVRCANCHARKTAEERGYHAFLL